MLVRENQDVIAEDDEEIAKLLTVARGSFLPLVGVDVPIAPETQECLARQLAQIAFRLGLGLNLDRSFPRCFHSHDRAPGIEK
ncbi:hypothetical protein D3C80_1839520 [compost metagenome]